MPPVQKGKTRKKNVTVTVRIIRVPILDDNQLSEHIENVDGAIKHLGELKKFYVVILRQKIFHVKQSFREKPV